MSETVERTSLDLRYQTYRLRNDTAEARLLASIAERDIEQPLRGVDTPQGRLLLDGFKRYRCATKLGIECVPYVSLGEEEAEGIASLMRLTKQKTLSILEQARFVVELLSMHDMSIADVAETLSRSKAMCRLLRFRMAVGHAFALPRLSVRHKTSPFLEVGSREQLSQFHLHIFRIAEEIVPVGVSEALGFGEQVDVLGRLMTCGP